MKQSRYNWIIDCGDGYLFYNGFSGAMLKLDNSAVHHYTGILDDPDSSRELSLPEIEARRLLMDSGFLIEDRSDEVEMLRHLMYSRRYQTGMRGMTVIVTTRCNFVCGYCTQSRESSMDMSSDVMEAVIRFVERNEGLCSVTLYGGEPLLVTESCALLASRIRDIVCRRGSRLSLDIITNGYLLTRRNAEILSSAGVGSVQITLDGNREHHDHRRILHGGHPTFDVIMSNIEAASDLMNIFIRMNLDSGIHSDLASVNDVIDRFRNCPNVKVYAAPTRWADSSRSTAENRRAMFGCLSEYFLVRRSICARTAGCGATDLSSCAILPDGRFAVCWDEADGPFRNYGNILENDSVSFIERLAWLGLDPYLHDRCRTCRFLPTCAGGCPKDWLLKGEPTCLFTDDSSYERFVLANFLHRMTREGGAQRADRREMVERSSYVV